MARLADLTQSQPPTTPGSRVLLDLRLLQEPARAPITAAYLGALLQAFATEPLRDEELIAIVRARRPDPTLGMPGLPLIGRRVLPSTARMLRSLALPLDSLLLRGAEVRAGRGAAPGRPVVFHSAGGAIPAGSRLPVVATLLDLAPWELPELYARTPVARFGQRTRAQGLRRAQRVLVGSRATAEAAVRLLDLDPARVCLVPLAADDAFQPGPVDAEALVWLRRRHQVAPRYLVVGGRYDARSDIQTLLAALRMLRARSRTATDQPQLVLMGAAGPDPEARSRVTTLAERSGVLDLVRLTPVLPTAQRALLEAGAVAHVQPSRSDANGIAALEALAVGVPVITSATGALPEIVGSAGIIVEPRDPARLAAAIETMWAGGSVGAQVTRAAHVRATSQRRRWIDVAADTRAAYAAACTDALG